MSEELLHILLIEDDEVDRLLVKRALRASGLQYELDFAEDYNSGIERAKEASHDFIFLDYKLPGKDGLSVLTDIREQLPKVPIVIITSHGDEKVAADAIKAGAADYIPKSLLTPEGLSQSIRAIQRIQRVEKRQLVVEEALAQTQQQLEGIISRAPIVVFALDAEGKFTVSEGKGLEQLGLKPGEIVGQSVYDVYANHPQILNAVQKSFAGETLNDTIELRGHFYDTNYTPVLDDTGAVNGITGIAVDVTTLKKTEEKMREAKDLAEESARMKQEFLANMSHEIRTPLNAILGFTDLLSESSLVEEQRTYVEAIQKSGDNLLVIINDILDFSKIEAGKLVIEQTPFSISNVLEEVERMFEKTAREKNLDWKVTFNGSGEQWHLGDRARINQILVNLIGNALKFTEQGSVSLHVEEREMTGALDELEFTVSDTGIGIARDNISKVFDSFTQEKGETTRKYGGTGLGLTIVNRLVQLLGGTIMVQSKVGEGTTFTVKLPFMKAGQQEEAELSGTSRQVVTEQVRKVLLVEDNPLNQTLAQKVIESGPYKVSLAENGQVALELLKTQTFDIILMDLQMPELDGYSATRIIRNDMGIQTPIIAMTAHALKEEVDRCKEAGMNAHISKPFKKEKLFKIIDQWAMEDNTRQQGNDNNSPGSGDEQPVANLTALFELAGGDNDFIREILTMFLSQTGPNLEKLQELQAAANWEEVRKLAHKLRSSTSAVGMEQLQPILRNIEHTIERGQDISEIPQQVQEVERLCNKAFTELEARLQEL